MSTVGGDTASETWRDAEKARSTNPERDHKDGDRFPMATGGVRCCYRCSRDTDERKKKVSVVPQSCGGLDLEGRTAVGGE